MRLSARTSAWSEQGLYVGSWPVARGWCVAVPCARSADAVPWRARVRVWGPSLVGRVPNERKRRLLCTSSVLHPQAPCHATELTAEPPPHEKHELASNTPVSPSTSTSSTAALGPSAAAAASTPPPHGGHVRLPLLLLPVALRLRLRLTLPPPPSFSSMCTSQQKTAWSG